MRSKLVAGNWKMHGSRAAIQSLLALLKAELPAEPGSDVVVFPPSLYIADVLAALSGSPVAVGAQNVCDQAGQGAFTGEVSAEMLADVGCRYAIVGHSERRALYGESSAVVAVKVQHCLNAGIVPILCVGETDEEREAGRTLDVVAEQLSAVMQAVAIDELAPLVVAYEPVWAIGTGKTASPEQAQEVHAYIRQQIAGYSEKLAAGLRILYGGSVKAANAAELFRQADIDGGLVGGASLDAQEFSAICRAAE